MGSATIKIPGMAKKKPDKDKRGPGRPPSGRRPFSTVYGRVDPSVSEALSAFIADKVPRTTINAVIELALVRYLESEGYWPPPDEDSGG
jgi:hypothetical protein